MQLVQVRLGNNKAYTYLWEGEGTLAVGDWVQIPANQVVSQPQAAQVVGENPDYYGRLTSLTKRVECVCDPEKTIAHYCMGKVY